MQPVRVRLTLTACNQAAAVGLARHEESYGKRTDTRRERSAEEDLEVHVLGALAEAAVYAWLKREEPWDPPMEQFHGSAPDIPPDIEVKASEDWPNLPIKDRDIENPATRNRRFVMVRRVGPQEFHLTGWATPEWAQYVPHHHTLTDTRYLRPEQQQRMRDFERK